MRKTLQQRKETGFTIVEVLIVLAIAGLIILVVLLAVPALQRNGRNTSMKSDASAVAGGISEFESNNDGAMPTAVAGTGTVAVSGGGTTTPTDAKVQGSTVVNSSANHTPAVGTISVDLQDKCTTTGNANVRAAAVWYAIENSSATPQYKCIDS
jgi:prepilin-type N-terminal cleavage/methylation domain-containing protein